MPRLCKQLILSTLFCLGLCTATLSQQLPTRIFRTADGLASSAVTNIARDSRGFMWFCTRDGISRFDGRQFVNFGIGDNPSLTFWGLIETRDGDLWISTSDGLYRITPHDQIDAKPLPAETQAGEPFRLDAEKISGDIRSVNVLIEDRSGRLWGVGGDVTLIRENGENILRPVQITKPGRQRQAVNSAVEARDGSIWLGALTGAIRILPSGKIINYDVPHNSDFDSTLSIAEDDQQRIWVGHRSGVFVIPYDPLDRVEHLDDFADRVLAVTEHVVTDTGNVPFSTEPATMFHLRFRAQTSDGSDRVSQFVQVNGVYRSLNKKMWVAPLTSVLYVFDDERYSRVASSGGFPILLGKMTEDQLGNYWLATNNGAMRLSMHGLSSYSQSEGLRNPDIQSIHEAADGSIYVVHGGDWHIAHIDTRGVSTTRFRIPEPARSMWTSNGAMLDQTGAWWVLTDQGLHYYPPENDFGSIGERAPQKIYTVQDGLPDNSLYCAFRDSKGGLWFSTRSVARNALARFEPLTQTFHVFTPDDGIPANKPPASFAEDNNGNLWFGFYSGGGLVRFSNGRFTDFSNSEGLPPGEVFGLYVDPKGRLWVGTSRGGVSLVDDPSAEKLTFVPYTRAEGLISNNVRALTGDLFGNIYVGTVRGISRINPENGRIKHYTTADGLAGDFVTSAMRDSRGTLWFGTAMGLSKLEPEKEPVNEAAPKIWIGGLNIAGVKYGVSEFGQREIAEIEVGHSENNLTIDFLSVGNSMRYQYKLEASGEEDWTAPSEQSTVNFASVAPGTYRFLVRAVNNDGLASEQPATVSIRIRPPFWQTWWFIAGTVLLVGLAVFSLDRYRVAKTRQVQTALTDLQRSEGERRVAETALQRSREDRLAELERVRTRIATDLHDDIGASLTKIAVLSQVAGTAADGNGSPLNTISETAVDLVTAMSDIVWAINPKKDNLNDLTFRMRRFAADVFSARGIHLHFSSTNLEEQNTSLGANIRREVFVMFKECVNNILKHADCKNVTVNFRRENERLVLEVIDDGRGFDVEKALEEAAIVTRGGNGLLNLERRAGDLGGTCEISSESGKGTRVVITVPLVINESSTEDAPPQMARENVGPSEVK